MERNFIAWAARRARTLPQAKLPIGDDAAVLAVTGDERVVTCDSLMDGTHFRLAECGAKAVGHKLAAVNLSDIAAMGAKAEALFLSFCLPRQNALGIAQELFEGAAALAARFDVAIAGGDTNVWDGPLVVHGTAVGQVNPGAAWTRRGARVGDAIVVTGTLGGSIQGHHLAFEPRLDLVNGVRQAADIHAACDISDGLGVDLLNILSASGCGAELLLDQIPVSQAAEELSGGDRETAIRHAIGDGEDFELLLVMGSDDAHRLPESIAGVPLTTIGSIVSRTGLWSRATAGQPPKQLPPTGYQHR